MLLLCSHPVHSPLASYIYSLRNLVTGLQLFKVQYTQLTLDLLHNSLLYFLQRVYDGM